MNKKLNSVPSAGTKDEQRTDADFSRSASVEASPMLADDVQEGNKLIAEFMGLKIHKNGMCDNPTNKTLSFGLQYHSSWDWLMPVYTKFKNIKSNDKVFNHYHTQICKSFESGILSGDIKNAFRDAVMSVKWYNNNIAASSDVGIR